MLKKWGVLLLSSALLLGACSEKEAEMKNPKQVTEVKEEKKLIVPEETKAVVEEFVRAFMEQDYEKIVNFYTEETVLKTEKTREELIQQLETNFEEKEIEVTGYTINDYASFEEKEYVAFQMDVTYEDGKSGKDIEKWMLVKEEEGYKFDHSLVVEEISLPNDRIKTFHSRFLYTDIHVYQEVGGYRFQSLLENLSKTKSYEFGKEKKPALAILTTDKGTYEMEINDKTELVANHKGETTMYFAGAEGTPLSIGIQGIYLLDEGGEAIGKSESFEIQFLE